jgi:hypothetical protein
MSPKETYYIDSEGPAKSAVEEAISWLLRNTKEIGYIAVMGYGTLQGYIKEVLGDRAIKSLTRKNGQIRIKGKTLTLVTERRKIYNARGEPIVAFYPNKKFLDEVDSISNVSALLVVPWLKKDIEGWVRTYNASKLNKSPKKPLSLLIDNRVVVEALKGLSAIVNKATGLSDPRDRDTAVQTFTKLRDAGEFYDPGSVKSWLVRHGGWKAPLAEEVAEVAQEVLEGRRLRKGREMYKKNIIDIWRKEAKKNKDKGDLP